MLNVLKNKLAKRNKKSTVKENEDSDLHDVLQSGYEFAKKGKKGISKKLIDQGYVLDHELSNHNHQAYYNAKDNKLLFNVNGTHNASDWMTNAALMVGRGKNTRRYKESHRALRKAKEKYGVDEATVTGHSQGGYTAGHIASKNDHVITLDKAATFFQPIRKNEKAYRTENDVVSILNKNSKHMKTLKNPNGPQNVIDSHDVKNIQPYHIKINPFHEPKPLHSEHYSPPNQDTLT